MYMINMDLRNVRLLAKLVSKPWRCGMDVNPEYMVGEYRSMFRSLLPDTSNDFHLDVGYDVCEWTIGKPVYETCIKLYFEDRDVGCVTRVNCDGDHIILYLNRDGNDDLSLRCKANADCRGISFDSNCMSGDGL